MLNLDPRIQKLTCKLSARDYISSIAGDKYCIPILYSYTSVVEIDQSQFPKECVIKPSHLSGSAIVIMDTPDLVSLSARTTGIAIMSKTEFDNLELDVKKRMQTWLNKDHVYHPTKYPERGYSGIQPRILVEPLLHWNTVELPPDYKFHYYNGSLQFVQLDYDRSIGHKRQFFDCEWNQLDVKVIFPKGIREFSKPIQFEEMVDVSRKLARGFELVRIDFLNSDEGLFVNEISFFPDGGFGNFNNVMSALEVQATPSR